MKEKEFKLTLLNHSNSHLAHVLSTAAGWNQTVEDWNRVLSLGRDTSFAGWIGDRLVVTGTLTHYRRCGWIGMLLVDQAYRRRGYATIMLDLLLKAAEERGMWWVGLDATELGKPLYLKRDFREIGAIDRWQLTRPHTPLKMLSIRQYDDKSLKDFESECDLDVEATGIDRKLALIFTAVALDTEDHIISEEEEEIVGFGISRTGRLGPYLGPVVARSSEIAAGIVSRLLERFNPTKDAPVFIDVPRGSSIEPWLRAEGFEPVRSWTRMVRGPAEKGNSEMIFAIAGPEMG